VKKGAEFWRVKRRNAKGLLHEVGSLHFTGPGGARINTHTLDVVTARKFRRDWTRTHNHAATVVEGTADAPLAALDGAGGSPPPMNEPPSAFVPPAAAAPLAAPPIAPDGYRAPDAGDWAGDAARAAGASTGAEAPPPQIDPAFLEQVIEQAATLAVELQIMGQEWAIRRGLKIKPGPIAPDGASRAPGVALWKIAIRQVIPADLPLPPWLAAIVITAATTIPVQLATAEPLPKDAPERKAADTAPIDTGGLDAAA
jgi:hypothetical protein